ncbi:something about silencing, SAS, complex subunit 4 [Rhizoctonia solani 123E]|uniref:Something about silencing, SAS, complex subunit 4 n=1 Tax=Rhizoctonia solani 123E TaxID=1423351 RepID=A0A074S4R3_9AGAM|nr:something about silencing, SAS, complex subunit 4 [Rhizoctonia solani 123E]
MNGYTPYSAELDQTMHASPDSRPSVVTPTGVVQPSRSSRGEGGLDYHQGSDHSFSPQAAPPKYPAHLQETAPASENVEFSVVPPSPSYKALGKRRASAIDHPTVTVDYQHNTPDSSILNGARTSPAPPYTSSTPRNARNTRQKARPKANSKSVARPPKEPALRRIMPSRQRRGATAHGIGSNPIDAMIIEAQQRAAEHVPIVDPEAVFLITTDPKGPPIAGPSNTGGVTTGNEDERYFEREEVAENMRQQATIQTPEYCLLSEVYQPSSRLRTRTEADVFDSSDAMYERLHRKPEMLEKRQRRREKDKLEHERYKLKERVEQLRAMDLHHFRGLLPSSHSTPGTESNHELETIRSELLAHADDLIRRYDVLLPPDPRAANGQRLRLKEWEVRREGNRFIPLTDEAASELAAAGLLDEQSAAEAAAAGILITAAGPGLPLGGKGGKGYGVGFRPDLSPSGSEDEVEDEVEDHVDEAEPEDQQVDHPPSPAPKQDEEPRTEDNARLSVPPVQEPPRPSSGMLKIKLKVPRPSATPRSSDLSQDNTRPPSEAEAPAPQEDLLIDIQEAPVAEPPQPIGSLPNDAAQTVNSPITQLEARDVPQPTEDYPTPTPSATSLSGAVPGPNPSGWTELPYHDVPYEHQPRGVPRGSPAPPVHSARRASSVHTPAAPRVKTPAASTPAPTGIPLLLVAAEREANQAAGRRGRNLRTAEAFGVKLPRALEEEKEFNLPEEWIAQHFMEMESI